MDQAQKHRLAHNEDVFREVNEGIARGAGYLVVAKRGAAGIEAETLDPRD